MMMVPMGGQGPFHGGMPPPGMGHFGGGGMPPPGMHGGQFQHGMGPPMGGQGPPFHGQGGMGPPGGQFGGGGQFDGQFDDGSHGGPPPGTYPPQGNPYRQ